MSYSFQSFMEAVHQDNPHYERWHSIAHVGHKSRLLDFVGWLEHDPHPTQAAVMAHMQSVPGNAWNQGDHNGYRNAKRYLAREFHLDVRSFDEPGAEVPEGEQPVLVIEVYAKHKAMRGYLVDPDKALIRASETGMNGRADGRFFWAIEVVYRLHHSMNPSNYAPVRQQKSQWSYTDWGYKGKIPAMDEAQIKASAGGKQWSPDGPVHYNVKREGHTISIWDQPGLDFEGAVAVTDLAIHYPIRFFADFTMNLRVVNPGKNLESDFNTSDVARNCGGILQGSEVHFSVLMSRATKDAALTGRFE